MCDASHAKLTDSVCIFAHVRRLHRAHRRGSPRPPFDQSPCCRITRARSTSSPLAPLEMSAASSVSPPPPVPPPPSPRCASVSSGASGCACPTYHSNMADRFTQEKLERLLNATLQRVATRTACGSLPLRGSAAAAYVATSSPGCDGSSPPIPSCIPCGDHSAGIAVCVCSTLSCLLASVVSLLSADDLRMLGLMFRMESVPPVDAMRARLYAKSWMQVRAQHSITCAQRSQSYQRPR
jgi:hypothetical protein